MSPNPAVLTRYLGIRHTQIQTLVDPANKTYNPVRASALLAETIRTLSVRDPLALNQIKPHTDLVEHASREVVYARNMGFLAQEEMRGILYLAFNQPQVAMSNAVMLANSSDRLERVKYGALAFLLAPLPKQAEEATLFAMQWGFQQEWTESSGAAKGSSEAARIAKLYSEQALRLRSISHTLSGSWLSQHMIALDFARALWELPPEAFAWSPDLKAIQSWADSLSTLAAVRGRRDPMHGVCLHMASALMLQAPFDTLASPSDRKAVRERQARSLAKASGLLARIFVQSSDDPERQSELVRIVQMLDELRPLLRDAWPPGGFPSRN